MVHDQVKIEQAWSTTALENKVVAWMREGYTLHSFLATLDGNGDVLMTAVLVR